MNDEIDTLHLEKTGGESDALAKGSVHVYGHFDADGELGIEIQGRNSGGRPRNAEAYLSRVQVKQLRQHLKRVLKATA